MWEDAKGQIEVSLKIAFTGKGGVGKTTLASLFIRVLSKDEAVLAVDCDPDANLGRALGFKDAEKIRPIVNMKEMIADRMGIKDGDKSFYQLNPKIDDIPDSYSKNNGNIKLIVMGAVEEGGSGCMCPESAFVKSLISHLILRRNEHVVMDMEAGVEHLGRGTAGSCDFVITVCEPTHNSVETAKRIEGFAKDIGVRKIYAVGNKIRSASDRIFLEKALGEIRLLESVEFSDEFLETCKENAPDLVSEDVVLKIKTIRRLLEEET
ncbi:MAG: AAA family ATPase [Candidatus Omnitrophota bacterium]